MHNLKVTPVAARFSEAAKRYEQEATIQKEAALQFDTWLAGQGLAVPERIAEIGCGTGLLTQQLHARYPNALLHATDLAPAMIDYCRVKFAPAFRLQFSVCDGRNASFDPTPDWIVSAMCFQWFNPLQPVLDQHLAASTVLAFSIVLDGSFSTWRTAHERVGLLPGLHACPNYEEVLHLCKKLGASRMNMQRISLNEYHANGLSFANSLRAIGADQPRNGHQPVNLRTVFRQLEQGFNANYEIGFFCIEK